MKNLGQMMKQAQQMQAKMAEMQEGLGALEISGGAGGGMVTVTLNGKGEMQGLKIDPSLVNSDDVEVLEDLVTAAFNDAKTKVEAHMQEEMSKLTGGLKLPPGMNLPF
ncbi:MAG: YbaB/EbfC family nucleoid-associated protein [Rhodospirillaceae bacterium]|nr:YbaB/EbfC family nucleoid-associated protein [Rhodospirillaceae bacterium]|tara:strand:- start:605 stop:928 length:324 start_codon:yes stop_codon:yes gene_type:complete